MVSGRHVLSVGFLVGVVWLRPPVSGLKWPPRFTCPGHVLWPESWPPPERSRPESGPLLDAGLLQLADALTDVERSLTERIADLIAQRDTLRQLAGW